MWRPACRGGGERTAAAGCGEITGPFTPRGRTLEYVAWQSYSNFLNWINNMIRFRRAMIFKVFAGIRIISLTSRIRSAEHPTSRVSDSVGLRGHLRIGISNKFPS